MIFLRYIIFFITADLICWLILWLIGFPGRGIATLLVRLSHRSGGAFKKILSVLLGFLSYLLNFTLPAFVWGIAISFITFITMTDASHPLLYFFLGSVLAFVFSIVTPFGKLDFLVAIQSLLVYLFYISGKFIETIELGVAAESYLPFFDHVFMISPIIFAVIVITGAVINIRAILKLMKEENLDKETLIFSGSKNIKRKKQIISVGKPEEEIPESVPEDTADNQTIEGLFKNIDEHTNKSLLNAVKDGNLSGVKIALENGADVNAKSDKGITPLMWASVNGHTDIAKLLIEKDADVNAKSDKGITPLMSASVSGQTEVAKLLIENGADVNAKDRNSGTALMEALFWGHTDIAKLLIEKGADVNAKNNNGITALMFASRNGNVDIAKLLIEGGANINTRNSEGATALMWASLWDQVDVVRLLIENGADVNRKDNEGITALAVASKTGNTEIMSLLKNAGAKG